MINQHEHEFLTQTWKGVKGAAYNACFEFCRQHGLTSGFDNHGRPILTRKGVNAIKSFQSDDNYKRIDVI